MKVSVETVKRSVVVGLTVICAGVGLWAVVFEPHAKGSGMALTSTVVPFDQSQANFSQFSVTVKRVGHNLYQDQYRKHEMVIETEGVCFDSPLNKNTKAILNWRIWRNGEWEKNYLYFPDVTLMCDVVALR